MTSYHDIADEHGWKDFPVIRDAPETLYHYTNASGLVGMLSSNQIWATDYRYLNDTSEISYTDKLAIEIIADRLKDKAPASVTDLYSSILSNGTVLESDGGVCIFSMTEEADSLSQWRAYSREGRGFAVGFDASVLIREATPDDAAFGVRKVVYDEKSQRNDISNALDIIEEKYRTDVRRRVVRSELIADVQSAISTLVSYRATSNKHKAFSSEREWRLVAFPEAAKEYKVRVRNEELIPYIALHPNTDGRLPISRIGIGPGLGSSNQREAVELLCRQFGYKPDIYLADAPFRPLG